ncbi:MAG: Alanine racemase [Candidatus Woesebacteria bacterium GW2011_GWB1_45_5]|uniref:Alanine racemase n=1 Tax=Candidatus Woesebacteria bacterium GW2011_GWB1_45_5 TaxID=1618581 RepID=A0A0G1MMW4_9BACT|nr:MAG: Alanine racemase [Candidatus Woesebacteria bacterium GW2011_GWB1_45_5]
MRFPNNKDKTRIEVSRSALLGNIATFRKVAGKKTEVAAVVKANAYGHGLPEVVQILKRAKVKVFCVDNIDEAEEIREIDKSSTVIILGYTTLANIKRAVEDDISFVVYNIESLRKIVALNSGRKAKIHIKTETGLNRQGASKKELIKLLSFIKKHKDKIDFEGISSHFANVEDTLDPAYPMSQLKRFDEAVKVVKSKGFKPPFVHCAASAAALLYKEAAFSLIRVGIGLYGLWPSRETKIALSLKKKSIKLIPALAWKSIIAQVKNIGEGESVGYGRTWFSSRKSKVAIVPVGYSDGLDRKLSSSGNILVKGKLAPIIGRVAMNMITVDVTDIPGVKTEDEVVIIGKSIGKTITAEEMADKIDTINYEVVSRINPLIPRIVIK